ncbi:MAG: SiaB family protein kinase [Bacteroidia bacterium]
MNTTQTILSQVSEIYHLNKWRGEKKLLIYSDKISNSKMESFLRNAEKKLEKHVDDSTFRRRVFSILIECFQNINLQKQADKKLKLSLLSVGLEKENKAIVISGNTIKKEEVSFLLNKIQELNSMNREQVKHHFKELLANTELAKLDESGLYLVDIARKARSKLRYGFFPIDDKHLFFTLKITVNKEIMNTF